MSSRPSSLRHPRTTLWLIALLSGVAWRAELELRTGWASLDWIGQFHWAIPAGVFAFILWVLSVTRVQRPWAFAATLLVYSTAAYFTVGRLLMTAFGRWMPFGDNDQHSMATEKLVSFLLIVLVPITFSILCRLFGIRVRLLPVLASAILFMLSWPLAAYAFYIVEQRGMPGDPIHALKSGYVIPLLILSLGLPVLRARRDAERG
ncbi:hypothetical protein [Prosthecobacter sp.]|jgi:hypothetical protein|uniref:hypothetical protein n=1 Tax=Prosthecobacter sp. TaxID=1965333 RepID=UPI0037CB0903